MNLLVKILKHEYALPIFLLCITSWFCLWAFHIAVDPLSSFGAPDEGLRYLIPKFIFDNGQLPTGYDAATIHTMGNWSYAFYPQFLGAIVSAFFMMIAAMFSSSPESLLYGARMGSVLFGVVAVFFVGKSVEKLFKGNKDARLYSFIAMIMFALWPQVAFLSAYVNNDIVGLCGVSILMFACVSGYKDSWSVKTVALLALGFVVCLLGYINSYGFVLFAGLFFLVSYWWQKDSIKHYFRLVGIAFVITCILAGPFFVRNAVIYKGDVFGMATFRTETLEWEVSEHKEAQRSYSEITGRSVTALIRDEGYVKTQISSTIARFGKMTVAPEDAYMNVYRVVILGGCVGFLWMLFAYGIRRFRRLKSVKAVFQEQKQLILLLLCMIGASLFTVALSVYYSFAIDFQPQGRYVIYLLVPVILTVVCGIVYIVREIIVRRYQRFVLLIVTLLYVLTSGVIFYKYVYIVSVLYPG